MHFQHTVSVVACCLIIKFGFIKSQRDSYGAVPAKSRENVEDDEAEVLGDGHSFVALIDVVFPDGSKRTCTGTIIHDNVVITAAHCFVHETDEEVQPELTACFVVIGTRKMYEAGYEQYLPIEKILTHPKYHGWKADLSLVFTFAGMTSDKPGKIVKIGGEKLTNPVDSNITIFSWGCQKDDEFCQDKPVEYQSPVHHQTKPTVSDSQCDDSSSDDREVQVTAGIEEKRARIDSLYRPTNRIGWNAKHLENSRKGRTTEKFREGVLYKFPVLRDNVNKGREKLQQHPLMWQPRDSTTTAAKKISRYLSEEDNTREEGVAVRYLPSESQKYSRPPVHSPSLSFEPYKMEEERFSYGYRETTRRIMRQTMTRRTRHTINRSWRRAMGTTENKLSVLTFGVINNANCKKIVENALAPRYEYVAGEIACFSSDEHSLSDDDTGSPAIRRSELFAVIIGGVESEGEHVGIGLRMSCYCSWISDNLPGGDKLTCCKNCCDVRHTEIPKHTSNAKKQHNIKYEDT